MNQKTANKKYNPNSAITHLQRMGKSIQGAACIDNVSLTYSGNKLNTAQDTGISASMMGDAFHFVDGDDYYSEYGYDGCGSLTSDSNKGIHMIVYDFNGMPTCVWFDNGSITDYVYTADGVKLKTVHRTAVPGTVPSGSTPSLSEQNTLYKDSTLYIGALEVNSNIKEKYHFAGGFMEIMVGSLDTYNYYNTDHLGNVRHVSRSTPSGTATIAQANNYYPFGGLLKEGEHHWDIQNRFYNGKEYDRMQGLNLYDYSARQYDPAVCQFTSMDPLCEKYYHISPYIYCAGNPVKYVDPDGRELYINGTDEERKQFLSLLQSLTNNVLTMNEKGMVSIGQGMANKDMNLSVGTGLIADIINNKHRLTMSVGDKHTEVSNPAGNPYAWANNDGSPRQGSDVIVNIDLKDRQHPKFLVGNNPNKEGTVLSRPLNIGVAHELVHGLRGMEGVQVAPGVIDKYQYNDGVLRRTQDYAEELRTIGITGNYRYTENKIRREHGLQERRMYNSKK